MNGLPRGWSESNDISGTFAEMFKWARVVCESTACDLPGVHIKFGSFVSNMWKAVRTICGVKWWDSKDLWWDSFSGTRTLEERKLLQYMDMLLDFSTRKTLTLLERQQAAGRYALARLYGECSRTCSRSARA